MSSERKNKPQPEQKQRRKRTTNTTEQSNKRRERRDKEDHRRKHQTEGEHRTPRRDAKEKTRNIGTSEPVNRQASIARPEEFPPRLTDTQREGRETQPHHGHQTSSKRESTTAKSQSQEPMNH